MLKDDDAATAADDDAAAALQDLVQKVLGIVFFGVGRGGGWVGGVGCVHSEVGTSKISLVLRWKEQHPSREAENMWASYTGVLFQVLSRATERRGYECPY